MSNENFVYIVGEISVKFSVPGSKNISKEVRETIAEFPDHAGAYTLTFSGDPKTHMGVQGLPLYPRFFQGEANGKHDRGVVAVTFSGGFKVPVGNGEFDKQLIQLAKSGESPFIVGVQYMSVICELIDDDGKKVMFLPTGAKCSIKSPKGVKFAR
jgi:hypothetical protein